MNRSRCFSGTSYSNVCLQFDLCFLWLSKPSLYNWKLLVQVLLKPRLKDFEHNLASMWNVGQDEAQAGIKIAGRKINNLRYADDTIVMAESEELKSLLMKERGEWKSWLKAQHSENEDHGIWSHHFMANKWGNSGWLYFSGLQNHCRWWLQPGN